jgi:hypothetical protein
MGVAKITKSYEEVGDVGGSELRKNDEVVVGHDVPILESSVPLEMRELVSTYLNKYYLGVTIARVENNTIRGLWLLLNCGRIVAIHVKPVPIR